MLQELIRSQLRPPTSPMLGLAEAIIPPAARAPGADERVLRNLEDLFTNTPAAWSMLGWVQTALDWAAVVRTGHRFSKLSRTDQQALLSAWEHDRALRVPLAALSMLYKVLHYDQDYVFEAFGGERPSATVEHERWMTQVTRADAWTGESTIECDVVVVGTGAGGAVVGRELADRGHAVVFVEEGELYLRSQLGGSALQALPKFRGKPVAFAVGNNVFPVFMGQAVGGSTIANTASCWRTPDRVLNHWCDLLETDDFSPEQMKPRFARIENELRVTPVARAIAGPIADIFERGCERLGWSHRPVERNAPDCVGEGFCQYGCASGARRSTERTFIPSALSRGAVLLTGLRAERVLVEGGRAVGVAGTSVDGGRELRVRARTVILACGAVPTPALLTKQGLCETSGQVGSNLTLHPSAGATGVFDEPTRPHQSVPQGWACDQFIDDGILLVGAQPTYNVGAVTTPLIGDPLARLMDEFDHIAGVGILAEDGNSAGRVSLNRNGHVLMRYSLTRQTVATMQRGVVLASEMLLAAGARRVIPGTQPACEIRTGAELDAYAGQRLRASDLALVSFHPLGTCRMGRDPKTSVIGPDHETHDVPGLFLVDGSAVPTSVGVNPQITIMAMAERAAALIDEKLS